MAQENTTAPTDSNPEEAIAPDLRRWFPNASDSELNKWHQLSRRVNRFIAFKQQLPLSEDILGRIDESLMLAQRHLTPDRPYTISVIGTSGAGKSSLINALLGRKLVTFKYGLPTTGTIVTVRQSSPRNDSSQPVDRALVYYHSFESLAEMLEEVCKLVEAVPVYARKRDGEEGIDIAATLNLLKNLKSRTRSNENGEYANNLEALIDILQTASKNEELLMKTEPDVFYEKDFKYVQELMNEESPLNKSAKRLIPLIRRIEFEVVASVKQGQPVLQDIALTDVPGAAARTKMHDIHLRNQLDPRKTDAIILVMKPDRPEILTDELLPLIKNVLMKDLRDDNQRRVAAGSIFLVVNHGDLPNFMYGAEQGTVAGIQKIAEAILPDFFDSYKAHIFIGVMALPALIAELINENPSEARRWFEGAQVSPFEDLNSKDYLAIRQRARESNPGKDAEQAVLEISKVPQLRSALNDFLSRQRWEQDLKAAQDRFENAHYIATQALNAKWKDISGHSFGPNSTADLDDLTKTKSIRFGEQLQVEAQQLVDSFVKACNGLHQQSNAKDLIFTIEEVLTEIQQFIEEHTGTPEFKKELANITQDEIYGDSLFTRGAPRPLLELNKLVLRRFDGSVEKITATMMNAFEQELLRYKVEASLRALCHNQPYSQEYLKKYRGEIVDHINNKSRDACRGALLYQVMQRRVVQAIMTLNNFGAVLLKPDGQAANLADEVPRRFAAEMGGPADGTPVTVETANPQAIFQQAKPKGTDEQVKIESVFRSAKTVVKTRAVELPQVDLPQVEPPQNEIESLIQVVHSEYEKAHRELVDILPDRLRYLFFYHLTIAKEEVVEMIRKLTLSLIQDVADKTGNLYKTMDGEGSEHGQAIRLIESWQGLQQI